MGMIGMERNAILACVRSGKRMRNRGTNTVWSTLLGSAPFCRATRRGGTARVAKSGEQSL
jgi:hypothetical protein